MKIAEILADYAIPNDIHPSRSGLTMKWLKQESGVDIFESRDSANKNAGIGNEADYLQLFGRLAEKMYASGELTKEKRHIFASNNKGMRLYIKEFTSAERGEIKSAYISLLRTSKTLGEFEIEGGFSFYGEAVVEGAGGDIFETRSKKVARILDGENLETWREIVDNRFDFLKLELFVFSLQKLHSWMFQAIDGNGLLIGGQRFVRAIRPKPRGAKLK
jgi:hypothetical protein